MINEIIGNKNEVLVKIYNEEYNLKNNSENFIKFYPKKFKQSIPTVMKNILGLKALIQ